VFHKIELAELAQSESFKYAQNLPWFKDRHEITFKPGLNIFLGPNGSGKSTVLKMLGDGLCATQGGVSAVTTDVLSSQIDMMSSLGARLRNPSAQVPEMTDRIGLKIVHDGQPVVYCDPRRTVGISGGALDDDFMDAGVIEAMTSHRRSHGELALYRVNPALAMLNGKTKFPEHIQRLVRRDQVNDRWQMALDLLETRLQARMELGQPTILLDEPESNYSLVWQSRLWDILARPDVADRFQIIVASHSAFALGIGHAHYVEMTPGFRDEAEGALRARFRA